MAEMTNEQIADALEQSIMGDTDIVKAAIARLRAPAPSGVSAPAAGVPAESATIAGLEAAVGHLSALVDQQRALLAEVEDVCGRDGHGAPFEDGESELIDRVRAHLAIIAAAPAANAQPNAESDFEHFVQEAIDRAPEPLRRLGEFLASVLDEDRWKTAERMLLGIAAANAQPSELPPEFIKHLMPFQINRYGSGINDKNGFEIINLPSPSRILDGWDTVPGLSRHWADHPGKAFVEDLSEEQEAELAQWICDALNARAAIAQAQSDSAGDARDAEPIATFLCGEVESTSWGLEQADWDVEFDMKVAERINAAYPGQHIELYAAIASSAATKGEKA